MNALLVLPILVPLLTACACVFVRRSGRAQRLVSLIGVAALLVSAVGLMWSVLGPGVVATQIGAWPAPFGITLVADLLSAVMVLITGIVGVVVVVYSLASIDPRREMYGFHPLTHALLMGVCGSFLTGDIFNLYVWFEVMLMSSFVLLVLGGERGQIEGAIKYVTLNLISSAIFLAAVGILYGLAGTLNMADLAVRMAGLPVEQRGIATTVGMMFLVAFGIKAGLFPLFFWLPASYHTPPFAVSALFAALLTKVGVYSIMRVFTLVFVGDLSRTHEIILILAALTMATGVLGAVAQQEVRRILSFHIVSQIGYMIMGVGLMAGLASGRTEEALAVATLGLAGSIFYLLHHIIVKANLFLIAGVMHRLTGTGELARMGGLLDRAWWLGVLFMIPAMSLAGIPPLSGFFAKFALIKAGLMGERWAIVAFALGAGLLTLLSMTKIWAEAYWAPAPDDAPAPPRTPRPLWPMVAPIVLLAAITITVGLCAGPLFAFATRAAEQLLDPSAYIDAVLGPDRALPAPNGGAAP